MAHRLTYWEDKERTFEESKKSSSRAEFYKKSHGAYVVSKKNGWLVKINMNTKNRKHRGYWGIKKNVIEESKQFSTRTEFKKKSGNAYNSAIKNKWINEMPWLDEANNKLPKGYWKNEENMMKEAKKYSTKEEFKNGNLTAFLAAYKYGFIEKMHWLVKRKQNKWGHWTYKNIEKEALKYNTKTDFFKGSQTAYRAALKLGIIDDFFSLSDYVA